MYDTVHNMEGGELSFPSKALSLREKMKRRREAIQHLEASALSGKPLPAPVMDSTVPSSEPQSKAWFYEYWVTQKLPQIYAAHHATFPIRIREIAVQICGNFWVTQ